MSATTCKCVKSKCLKLYCECYRQGITCNDDCMCIDCRNTKDHAKPKAKRDYDEDSSAVARLPGVNLQELAESEARAESLLNRTTNPSGYDLSLRKARAKKLPIKGEGCTCKNSKCLKKYCVCFNAEVECTAGRCRCVNCQNPNGRISKASTNAAMLMNVGGSTVRDEENTRCRCTRTNCLKLYCDCFRQDLVCNSDCGCLECKNTEEESGPNGVRTKTKEAIMKSRPHAFQTPKKKSGVGCSCAKNKCITKYCDCNALGIGCDPAVCTCINCENMMKPLSEMLEHELRKEEEDPTEVFAREEVDADPKIKGLQFFSHMIDDFEERRIADPSQKLNIAYIAREAAADTANELVAEEEEVRSGLDEEIRQLEAQLEEKIKKENDALKKYRQKTNKVMCLEMEEPCRWNKAYQNLKDYVIKEGDLPPVPSACATEADRRLSIWVQEQKSLVYSKSERIVNAPHRIEALESLGVEWLMTSEGRWNKMYNQLNEYKRKHGTVKLPSFMQCRRSKDKQLIALRHWVDQQEQEVRSGAMAKRRDRLKKLQELGLPLKLCWEEEWKHYIVQLLKFRSKHGHLIVVGSEYTELEAFVQEVLKRLKKGNGEKKLTVDEKNELIMKGLLGDLKDLLANPTGRPTAGGQALKLIPLERVKEVNYWAGMLEQLKAYQAEFNTLTFPPPVRGGNRRYLHLQEWVEAQRKSYEDKALEESRIKELSNIGLEFDPWKTWYAKLKKFKREGGTARLPKEYKKSKDGEHDEELEELCKWLKEQVKLYRKDELDSEKKKQLRKLGVKLTKNHMGKVSWEERFEEMIQYYHDNNTCLPKRDGPLRQWVLDLIQTRFISKRRQKMIDEQRIGPFLRPEVIFKEPTKKKRKGASLKSDGNGKKVKMEAV